MHVSVYNRSNWLHRDGSEFETREVMPELSPRERQIVNLLLNGESRDSIAAQLGLSRYTINAYFRSIYRTLAFTARNRAHGEVYRRSAVTCHCYGLSVFNVLRSLEVMINYLSAADVERMVRCMGAASGPAVQVATSQSVKLKLAGELVALVEADLSCGIGQVRSRQTPVFRLCVFLMAAGATT